MDQRYMPVYFKMSEVSESFGIPEWKDKNGSLIKLNEKSHPHFNVSPGTKEYFILAELFSRIKLDALRECETIKIVGVCDEYLGELEYLLPWHKDNQRSRSITVVLQVGLDLNLYLLTAFYGMGIPKDRLNTSYLKINRREHRDRPQANA